MHFVERLQDRCDAISPAWSRGLGRITIILTGPTCVTSAQGLEHMDGKANLRTLQPTSDVVVCYILSVNHVFLSVTVMDMETS